MPSTNASAKKAPCKLCQRSRWLMTVTILVVLFSVTFLNLAG